MPTITAKCKVNHPGLNPIVKKGEIVKIIPVLYEKDTMIVDDWYLPNNKTQKMELAAPKIIAPKGSYKDYILQTKNGNKYASSSITNIIGYKSLSDIFEKV